MPLCHDCHEGLRGLRWDVVASDLRRRLLPSEVDYIIRLKGQGWLDMRYPEQPSDRSVND